MIVAYSSRRSTPPDDQAEQEDGPHRQRQR